MKLKEINEIKKQLWDYLEYIHVRWEEWEHQILYKKYCGLVKARQLCESEIEFWKTVVPDE